MAQASPAAPPRRAPDLDAALRELRGVREALASTPLSAALEPSPVRDLVVLYDTQTVGDALQTLAAWNILSAPVVKGGPPWLRRDRGEAKDEGGGSAQQQGASRLDDDVGANNPALHDLLGFLSVDAIMRAVVAGARARRAAAMAHARAPMTTATQRYRRCLGARAQRRRTFARSAARRSWPRRASCGARKSWRRSVRARSSTSNLFAMHFAIAFAADNKPLSRRHQLAGAGLGAGGRHAAR